MADFYFMSGTGSQMTEKQLKKMKENLKKTLGAQFTEKEAEKLLKRKK